LIISVQFHRDSIKLVHAAGCILFCSKCLTSTSTFSHR
jgi:hypothetical protein